MHAVVRCPSVCPSCCLLRSYIVSKRVIVSSNFFHGQIATTFLVFPYQTLWQYSDGDRPPSWDKNRDFWPVYGVGIDDCWTVECRQHFDGGVIYSAKRRRLLVAGDRRRSATHQWILFTTESLDVTPKTTATAPWLTFLESSRRADVKV